METSNEQIISEFLQSAYTDEKLAALLAHAEDGKLAFMSCCCFIGVVTSDHALAVGGQMDGPEDEFGLDHYDRAGLLPNASGAESAYFNLALSGGGDALRRAKLIPLIKAEMARREQERGEPVESESLVTLGTLGVG